MTTLNIKNPILIDLPIPIETDRLIIREPRAGDGQALYDAKVETWDMLKTWMPWAKEIGTADETEIVMREKQAEFILRTDLMMVVVEKATDQLIAGTGLHRFDWNTRIIEIGYWYRKSAQGKGYATESTKALIKYAFDVCQATKVTIAHGKGNNASKRVIEKCGFELEYVALKDSKLPNGEFVDHPHYYLFNADHLNDFNVEW